MRLYGSSSRVSRSATRYAVANRPVSTFDAPSARRRSATPSEIPGTRVKVTRRPVFVPRQA
jgi:hypothetical protein